MPNPDEMRRMMSELLDNSKLEADKNNDVVNLSLIEALETLRAHKPNNRSELDRRYAIVITKMEDVFAYFHTFIFENKE